MRSSRNPTGDSPRVRTLASLARQYGWIVFGLVLVSAVLAVLWGFSGAGWWHTNNVNDDLQGQINELKREHNKDIKNLNEQVHVLNQQITVINQEIVILQGQVAELNMTANCSVCSSIFVSQTTFNETISVLEEDISLLNGTCSDCVNQTTFDNEVTVINSNITDINNEITDIDSALTQVMVDVTQLNQISTGNNWVRAEGFFGAIDPALENMANQSASKWGMPATVGCSHGIDTFVREQTNTTYLTIDNLEYRGFCERTGKPLLFKTNGTDPDYSPGVMFCPCESGYYMVGMTVQNLYVTRTSPIGPQAGFDGTYDAVLAQTRGGTFKFGLVYAPRGGGPIPTPFNEGPWPLPPVWAQTWATTIPQNETLPDYKFDGVYQGIPESYDNEDYPFQIISFSDGRPLYLPVDVPNGDTDACYKFAMEIYDPFHPNPVVENDCGLLSSAAIKTAVWYTFFAPPELGREQQKMYATFNIQRLAWTTPQPDYVYEADQRYPDS